MAWGDKLLSFSLVLALVGSFAGAAEETSERRWIVVEEGSTLLLAGTEAIRHVRLPAASDTVTWQHTVDNRTISAGEVQVTSSDPVVIRLPIPTTKPGVALETNLSLTWSNAAAGSTRSQMLWIVDPDPYALKKTWLKDLNLALYDPAGDTAKAFEDAKIPFLPLASLGAVDQVDKGVVVIGEGIDLTRTRGVGEAALHAAQRGLPVLMLAPSEGELPYPELAEHWPTAMRFARGEVLRCLDKRLTADTWSGSGAVVHGFVPSVLRGQLGLQISTETHGWPWIGIDYPDEGSLLLCGYPLIATWKDEPAARYLLAAIFEKLHPIQETTDR
jgi:hypothetical protein